MNIERALPIPGWMNPPELEYLAYRASVSLTYAEIGSWRGKSARAVADNLVDGGVLFCIDTWADHAHGIPDWWTAVDPPDLWSRPDWLYREFMKNISDSLGTKIFALRMDSVSAARALEGVKMFNTIFIDAGHTYEEVKADILAWKPLLNPNGVMCGHDFHEVHHPGVVLAVRELVPEFRVVEDTTVWTTEPE